MATNKINPFKVLGRIAFVAIFAVLYFLQCTHKEPAESTTIVKSDTLTLYKWDTVFYGLQGNTIHIVDSVPFAVPTLVDTDAILQDYFTRFDYIDTLRDSNIVAVLFISVAKNRVVKDSIQYKWVRPEITRIITNTVKDTTLKGFLLVGLAAGTTNNRFALGPQLLYMDRKRRAYGAGVDLFNKSYQVNFYLPIKFKN